MTRSSGVAEENSHGDSVRHLSLQGRDTLQSQVYHYEYDRHGNWIKNIATTLKEKAPVKDGLDPRCPG